MAILRIFSYYGEPMAEVNTAEFSGELEVFWPLSKPDRFSLDYFDFNPRRYARCEVIEQKMLISGPT